VIKQKHEYIETKNQYDTPIFIFLSDRSILNNKTNTKMKKISFFFAGFFILLMSTKMYAQPKSSADYFKGKWRILIKGTPDGDARMIFLLENMKDSITGVVQDTTGAEISKISKVELTDSSVNVYFTAQGDDVNVLMNKKDEDHITGSLMGMFDVAGERVKKIL
jgi:hypothetical protein